MTVFGDSEPEDAWDRSDPPELLLENLRRRVLLLVVAGRSGTWTPRDEQRAEDLDEDLEYLIERLSV